MHKKLKKSFQYILSGLLFLSFISSAKSFGNENINQIFNRVSLEMKITKEYSIPKINFVSRKKLRDEFRIKNLTSYQKWVKEYGKSRADEFTKDYLNRINGFYVEDKIYIDKNLPPCKRESIIAHEIVHFLQERKNGKVNEMNDPFWDIKLIREMQAYKIQEEIYKKCKKNSNIQSTNQLIQKLPLLKN